MLAEAEAGQGQERRAHMYLFQLFLSLFLSELIRGMQRFPLALPHVSQAHTRSVHG